LHDETRRRNVRTRVSRSPFNGNKNCKINHNRWRCNPINGRNKCARGIVIVFIPFINLHFAFFFLSLVNSHLRTPHGTNTRLRVHNTRAVLRRTYWTSATSRISISVTIAEPVHNEPSICRY
jgi:hypothetical protein